LVGQVEGLDGQDGQGHHQQRPRPPGEEAAHQQQGGQRGDAHGQGGQIGVGEFLDGADQLLDVAAGDRVDAEQLMGLVDDDADGKADHKAAQHRLGQEVGDPTHPQQPEEEVDDPGHQGQGGGVANRLAGPEGGRAHDRADHGG
jgi:hypothetical protein